VTAYVALLRAVNLMRTSRLAMADLKAIAEKLGFGSPRTYIASGNLVFTSGKSEARVHGLLEKELRRHMGKPVTVMVRTAAEMAAVSKANPFPNEPGNRVLAIFLDAAPAADAIETAKKLTDEEIALGRREIYVHYPHGQGASRLIIPAATSGTARNLNVVARLSEMAKELP
jgi:uncharacterized protein (DUF1697 family)